MSTEVYTGVWTNWSQGSIKGATLTLSTRNGAFLTAFLALFVTLVATQLWRFLCYVVHQLRLTSAPRDRIFQERQVILRNIATPATGVYTFLMHGFQSRRREQRSFFRALPWALFSMLYLAVFAVAAVFSSNISKLTGDERLVQSGICGLCSDASNTSLKLINDTLTAANYARACYGGNPKNAQCSRLPVRQITYTSNQNASCPFEEGLCMYGDTAALQMTTKLIDSHFDLGINGPQQNRAQLQFMKTCAPLNTTNYVVRYNATADDPNAMAGDKVYEYQFGPVLSGLGRDPDLTTYLVRESSYFGNNGYIMKSFVSIANSEVGNSWTPIPALNRTDADVSIFFLEENTIRYTVPTDDPWFAAHQPSTQGDVFFSDDWASALACAEQTRVCNPHNNVCTPYQASGQLFTYLTYNYKDLGFNTDQLTTLLRMLQGTISLTLGTQIGIRMASALRAAETCYGLVQGYVPNTQWMIEAGSWFDTALAKLQNSVLEYATGPSNPEFVPYCQKTKDTGLLLSCRNQIIHDSSNTVSFSMLGLVILFVLGGLAILLNQLVEPVVGLLQKKTGRGSWKQERWLEDDVMSLHTAALLGRRGSAPRSFVNHERELVKHEGSSPMSALYSPAPTQGETVEDGTQIVLSGDGYKQVYLNDYGAPFTYSAVSSVDQDHVHDPNRRSDQL